MDPVSRCLGMAPPSPIFFVLWLIAKRKLSAQASEAEKAASASENEKLAKLTAEHEATKANTPGSFPKRSRSRVCKASPHRSRQTRAPPDHLCRKAGSPRSARTAGRDLRRAFGIRRTGRLRAAFRVHRQRSLQGEDPRSTRTSEGHDFRKASGTLPDGMVRRGRQGQGCDDDQPADPIDHARIQQTNAKLPSPMFAGTTSLQWKSASCRPLPRSTRKIPP